MIVQLQCRHLCSGNDAVLAIVRVVRWSYRIVTPYLLCTLYAGGVLINSKSYFHIVCALSLLPFRIWIEIKQLSIKLPHDHHISG